MFNSQLPHVIVGCAFGAASRKRMREAPPPMTMTIDY